MYIFSHRQFFAFNNFEMNRRMGTIRSKHFTTTDKKMDLKLYTYVFIWNIP